MITRVTDNIKFNMITNNLFNISGQYGKLMEQLSTQKQINRPSDNPIGINDILDYRTSLTSIAQYKTNIKDADISLTLAGTNLSGLRKIAEQVRAIAVEESGAGASPETRQSSLATLNSLMDEALSLLNAQNGDNYLFGGSATDVAPFSATYAKSAVGEAVAASSNTYAGAVSSAGTFSKTSSMTYVVRIIEGGALADATYSISTDGGQTWGATSLPGDLAAGTISNIDSSGININFTAGTLAAGDTFTVRGTPAGYYHGNDDKLQAVIGRDHNLDFNITGSEAFAGQFASASVENGGGGITANDTIVLTRGATPDSWAITSQSNYPLMSIMSPQTTDTLRIDADNDGTEDITIDLTGEWEDSQTISLSLTSGITTGQIPATFSGSGNIDLLGTMQALKAALEEPDQNRAEYLIVAQLENIKKAETQILLYETNAGAKRNSLTVTDKNHDSLNLQLTDMLADIENADLTKLITAFQMKQIAMQASYNMASQIGKMTIMDYI